MGPLVINVLLAIGAILIGVFSSLYDEKKDQKMIAGIVIGVLMYVAGIGLTARDNVVSAVMLGVGSLLVAVCSYFYNKIIRDENASKSRKGGLIAGIVIGVFFLNIGSSLMSSGQENISKIHELIPKKDVSTNITQ